MIFRGEKNSRVGYSWKNFPPTEIPPFNDFPYKFQPAMPPFGDEVRTISRQSMVQTAKWP